MKKIGFHDHHSDFHVGSQGSVVECLTQRPKGRGFERRRRHFVVSLSKNINPSLVLVQPRKTRPFITERLLMGRKESNQTKQTKRLPYHIFTFLSVFIFWCQCDVFAFQHMLLIIS